MSDSYAPYLILEYGPDHACAYIHIEHLDFLRDTLLNYQRTRAPKFIKLNSIYDETEIILAIDDIIALREVTPASIEMFKEHQGEIES